MSTRHADLGSGRAPRGAAARPPEPPLLRLAVVDVDEDGSDRDAMIDVAHILYCCLGSAVLGKYVDAAWIGNEAVKSNRVYVRTPQRVYRTHFRTIAALLERLPNSFVQVNHGVAVNTARVEWPELGRQSRHRIGMRVAARVGERGADWVEVSRRHVAMLRRLFGLPPRT